MNATEPRKKATMPAMKRLLCVLSLASGLIAPAACARNPVTGKLEPSLISEQQEIQMGQQAAAEVEQSMGLVDDQALQDYVQQVGAQLAAKSERPSLPWHFRVVEDPTPNAFALPGGFIYVTRGLMTLMDSKSELATVVGHEIGHVTARHSVEQLSRQQLAQLGLGIGSILFPQVQQLGGLASAGLQLLFLKYSRDDERQADALGFRYAQQAGYDVSEMADVFVALQRIGDLEGQSAVPGWLATHPAPQERVKAVQERLAQLGSIPDTATVGRAEYLHEVDGLVYGQNPRNGYFQGTTFLHPDLRFRIDFPQGWQTQNLPQAVMAASGQQDAVIQLTVAQGSPDQAAQQFFSQQGVQQGSASRQSINGLPALTVEFQAQTQQGVVQGLATWVSHQQRTYQILGYTGASQYGAYARLFQQSLGSFRTLTDPQALAVQPDRLRVIRADRSETLATFNARQPSVVPIDELAIINQVESASSRVPAGTLVKRVVKGS